jgi:hypothetical protein
MTYVFVIHQKLLKLTWRIYLFKCFELVTSLPFFGQGFKTQLENDWHGECPYIYPHPSLSFFLSISNKMIML